MLHQQLVRSMQINFLHSRKKKKEDESNYTQYYAIYITLWMGLCECVRVCEPSNRVWHVFDLEWLAGWLFSFRRLMHLL